MPVLLEVLGNKIAKSLESVSEVTVLCVLWLYITFGTILGLSLPLKKVKEERESHLPYSFLFLKAIISSF